MTAPHGRVRRDRDVVAYLAFLSVILAFGIDASLPAFDELRTAFDLPDGSGGVSTVVTSYFVGMGVGQLVWGLTSDRFGRQRMVVSGLVLYGIGAAGAALAPSMALLLIARVVWGIGAAAPSVLRNSIARDLYEGDKLAQITSLTMAIFLLGPAIAPSIGELILVSGQWRYVFAAAVPLGLVGVGWAIRFGETLSPEHVRPFDRRSVAIGVRTFVRTRATVGYSTTIMLTSGAFFIYLGSGQPVVDEVYGLGDRFALIFAVVAVAIGVTVWTSSRVVARHGAASVGAWALAAAIAAAAVMLAGALVADGRPPFWFWLVTVTAFTSFTTVATPVFVALAMGPMARVAGTASAVNGVMTILVSALLAAVFDRMIETTITPMAAGFLLYTALAAVVMGWARGGSPEVVEPIEQPSPTRHRHARAAGRATEPRTS